MNRTISHPLARPITYVVDCRTCGRPWTANQIDADGNGPCCHATRLMDSTDLMLVEMTRVKAKLEAQAEQIRVLKLANKSLARMSSPEVTDLIDAARAWKDTYPLRGGMEHLEASQRLMAAIVAVEDAK